MKRLCGWLGRLPWFVSLGVLIIAGLAAYLIISSGLDYANSVPFCGTTCHVMDPEYTAYQRSFHARVRCADCHVGPGLAAEIKAKWEGAKELYMNITNTYERPIPSPVESLRPARETCEQCHWPALFYRDRAVELVHYAKDEANTRIDTYLLVKIGGGSSRAGLGRGIHWHIENPIRYVATDPQRQNIPWVQAQIDGKTVTFVDAANPLSETDLQQYEVREMDCIDCHNRATHVFRSAANSLDQALANGRLPADLPYLRKQAQNLMEATYAGQAEALAALAGLTQFYQQNYPQLYEQRQAEIQQVVTVVQELYTVSHFPAMEVYPATYPNNLGHAESAGCFRCHDGKHVAEDGSSIRLHCNICHTIPQTVAAGDPVPAIPFQEPQQPASHLASNWIAGHRSAMDESCAGCHQVATFCANPNCHGRSWPYVNLEVVSLPYPLPEPGAPATVTPAPATVTPAPAGDTTVAAGRALFAANCTRCHERPPVDEPERDEIVETVRQGRPGEMPAFRFDDAQMETLVAFIGWWLQHPGEAAPTPAVSTAVPTPAGGATPVPGSAVSFAADILPVLQAKCGASCHSASAARGGFKAVDYAGVQQVVTPSNPAASRIVQVQQGPHPGKLTAEELQRVIDWIKAGASNN